MAKLKQDLLEEAVSLGLKLTNKNTVAEISEALESAKAAATSPKKSEQKTAKAGKRSAKAVKEAEQKTAKQARKLQTTETKTTAPTKGSAPVPRPLIERRSKSYRQAVKKLEAVEQADLNKAAELAIATSTVKFDATVELHVRLNVDPKKAEQNIRDNVVLPSGTGKTVRIAVYTEDAKDNYGADLVLDDAIFETVEKGQINFDLLITTPKMMPKLARLAKILGPKGLMPSPKAGTVTNDLQAAVSEARRGKVEYRVDDQGIVHMPVGKVSFGQEKILANLEAAANSILANKPTTIKGNYIISAFVSTSMGPSIRISL